MEDLVTTSSVCSDKVREHSIYHERTDICCNVGTAALATEAPTPDLLLAKPHGRKEPIINRCMWKHIFTQGFYQLFWLFLIIYGANKWIHRYALPSKCSTYASLDLNYDDVQTLSSAATQTGGRFDACCSGTACFRPDGGIYLTGWLATQLCSLTCQRLMLMFVLSASTAARHIADVTEHVPLQMLFSFLVATLAESVNSSRNVAQCMAWAHGAGVPPVLLQSSHVHPMCIPCARDALQERYHCVIPVTAVATSAIPRSTHSCSAHRTLPVHRTASATESSMPCMSVVQTSMCGTLQWHANRPTQSCSTPSSSCRCAVAAAFCSQLRSSGTTLPLLPQCLVLTPEHFCCANPCIFCIVLACCPAQQDNTTVQVQIFNQINSRKIKDEYNPFAGLGRGAAFLYILLIEIVLQVRIRCSLESHILQYMLSVSV